MISVQEIRASQKAQTLPSLHIPGSSLEQGSTEWHNGEQECLHIVS
jgi:hypothetical protein